MGRRHLLALYGPVGLMLVAFGLMIGIVAAPLVPGSRPGAAPAALPAKGTAPRPAAVASDAR
ncbi:MAG TPA: hypothetical protein VHL98_15440 [Microvirga sp.]|jgi:hypothetical protein|nr:hypothetical protein [Microvirga sp.]